MEKALAYGNQLHVVFIDVRKVDDHVPINKLWDSLRQHRIHPHCINAVKNFYKRNISCVETRQGCSEYSQVDKGLRQGCGLSPIFKIYLNSALKH